MTRMMDIDTMTTEQKLNQCLELLESTNKLLDDAYQAHCKEVEMVGFGEG